MTFDFPFFFFCPQQFLEKLADIREQELRYVSYILRIRGLIIATAAVSSPNLLQFR